MLDFQNYILWSASIYAVVSVVKATAKANGVDKSSIYVRALPLIPAVVGAVSGLFIGPHFYGWPPEHGAFFGVGAAGVAALSHNIQRQTIKGRDDRLPGVKD